MKLSGSERKELRQALTSAYPSQNKLKRLIGESDLNINLEEIALGEDLNDIVYKLIQWLESHNQLHILIKAACDENPDNEQLQAFLKNRQTIFDYANIPNQASSFPENYWKEIYLILKEIHIDLITDACRCTLENINQNQDILGAYPELTKLDIPSLKKILLQKCPLNAKQAPTIVEFAERLAKEVEQPLQGKLKVWVKRIAKELNINLPTYSQHRQFFPLRKPLLQSYLMIIATPIDQNKVSLEAEFIPDYQSEDSKHEKIDLAEAETSITCSLTEIADIIYSFIRESRKKLKGKKYNLTIEVFLPIRYLNKRIELEQINYNNEIKTLGIENHFVLRCLERFSIDDEEYLNKLFQRWDILQQFLVNNPNNQDLQNMFEYIYEVDKCNWLELENSWLEKQSFGVKVKYLPDSHVGQMKFFQTLLRAGVPISLWARCDNLIDIDKFDSFLTVENLRNFNHFCESVWKFRREAYAKPDRASYLGYHLGFLYDNPYRLPFCLMPENQDFIETGY